MKKLVIAALALATTLSASPAFSQIYFEYGAGPRYYDDPPAPGTIGTRLAMCTMTTMTARKAAMPNAAGPGNTTDTAMGTGWCGTGTFATRGALEAKQHLFPTCNRAS